MKRRLKRKKDEALSVPSLGAIKDPNVKPGAKNE